MHVTKIVLRKPFLSSLPAEPLENLRATLKFSEVEVQPGRLMYPTRFASAAVKALVAFFATLKSKK